MNVDVIMVIIKVGVLIAVNANINGFILYKKTII